MTNPTAVAEIQKKSFHNSFEEHIASVWQDILEADCTSRNVSFFELGGNSLLAVQVVLRLRSLFDVSIPLGFFFEHPTVAALAEFIVEEHAMRGDSEH